jgi:hypothetical protein
VKYTPAVIDVSALQLMLAVLTGWLDRREREVLRNAKKGKICAIRQLTGMPAHERLHAQCQRS